MITAVIFFAHFIFALVIFTKKWQEESLVAGVLNIALIGILFSVGWTLTGIAVKYIMKPEGLGILYDRDAFSLTLLSIAEFFFYKMYYKDEPTEGDKEIQ